MCRASSRLGEAGGRSLHRAVIWALGETTAVTSEISAIRVGDVDDPTAPRWVRLPGTRRHDPRLGELSDWGSAIVARQLALLSERRATPATLLTYRGQGVPGEHGAQSAVCNAVGRGAEPGRARRGAGRAPASLRNWAGRRLYDAGLPLEKVAIRMGARSLDATAADIGLTWREQPMSREHYNTWTRVRAVLGSPSLYELAPALDWPAPVGRPRANPAYVTLAYGVLARIARSGIRVELDLAEPHTWAAARRLMVETIDRHGLDLPPPGTRPPTWDHWRWMRNHWLATDEGLAALARVFPPVAAAAARRIGLLDPAGPGSLTHPDATRAAYGDGTLVRPLYRPPETVLLHNDDDTTTVAYPDPRTGQLLARPPGRFDPDLELHHGRGGPVLTHGYVCWHTRGPKPYQRIDLAAAHIPAPGAEAATAVTLLRDVHRAAGTGIQVVVYDGALRGVHIEQIMTRYGYVVLAKQHTDAALEDPDGTAAGQDPRRPPGPLLPARDRHPRPCPPAALPAPPRRRRRPGRRDRPRRARRPRRDRRPHPRRGQTLPPRRRPVPLQRRLRPRLPRANRSPSG